MCVNKPHTAKILKHISSYIRYSIGLLVLFILVFSSIKVKATDVFIEINLHSIISYDEVPVDFVVNGYLRFETDVIITESDKVYINIEDLFKNLGIYCLVENQGDRLFGFIENENKKYSIDFNTKQVTIENRTIKSTNGIVKEMGAIYLESTILAEAFGISIIFNARSLSIKLEANFELPLIKQKRLEQMRKNISKLQDREIIADTILKRDYHLFKFGMMDWSIESYQAVNETSSNRIRYGVGTELFYGQANVSVYYDDRYMFDNRNLNYDWRWVDNDKNMIKQAQLGKISYQSIAFINSPVVGATINNSPNTVRKASGYYTINEYTEPNWTVELYINDVLVDYTIADASGLFVFKVPNVYGYTTLKLKFYGPLGEERIDERTVNVPYTFMPAKTFEYSLSGGILEDGKNSRFGRGNFSYGVNRFITVGGGVEYLSSITNTPFIPFAKVAIQPLSRLVFNLEYAHDVRMQGLLSYNFGKSAFLEIDYANYIEGQKVVLFKPDEELKARLTLPFKVKKISGFAKLNYNHYVYNDAFKFYQVDAVFSGYYKNYSANLSTLLNWVSESEPYLTSKLSLSYRMKNGFVFRPLAEYNISNKELMRCKVEIEKRVAKAYFSVSYERNIAYKTDNVFVSFRYDLPFARTGVSAFYNNNKYYLTENAQGSVAFGDDKTVKTSKNSSLSKGGFLLYPFLDLNQNGKLDNGEQMVLLSKVRVSGGKAIVSKKDTIVRVSDLNAFVNYYVEFSNDDLDNISWQFKHKTYQILVDPNQYKRVDIPIISVGEISGMVYLNNNNNLDGIGRITIEIYDKQGNKVAETLSERDGYFSYLGLSPNDYTVRIGEDQLKKLDYQSEPLVHNAAIKASIDGDVLEGHDFVLRTKEKRAVVLSVKQNIVSEQTAIKPEEIKKDSEKNNLANETKPFILEGTNSVSPVVKKQNAVSIIESPEKSNVNEKEADNLDNSSKSVVEANQIALESKDSESPVVANQNVTPIAEPSVKSNTEHVLVWGDMCDKPGNYYVQCGAFKVKSNAMNLALSIKQTTGMTVGVVLTDDFYKVQVECLSTKAEAKEFKIALMKKLAINEMFITARHYDNETINSASKSQTVPDSLIAFAVDSLNTQTSKNILIWGEICDKPGYYYVQCGAFKVKSNAMRLALNIKQTTGMAVGVVLTDGLFKVQVECVSTSIEAKENKRQIGVNGLFDDSFFIKRE